MAGGLHGGLPELVLGDESRLRVDRVWSLRAVGKWIDLHTPGDLEIHVVLDNLSAHNAPPVKEWLAKPAQKDRWHLHLTPTSSSWLNLVEGWFAQLANKRLRRSAFTSVAELTDAIEHWVDHWNDDPQPFTWTKTANDILNKVHRGPAALTHQIKSATDH